MEIVLSALGEEIRQYALKIYRAVAAIRQERACWTVHGCDEFTIDDRGPLIDEATKLSLVNIPSPTFQRVWQTRIALKLVPDADPQTKQAIKDEIEAAVTAEGTMAGLLRSLDDRDPEGPGGGDDAATMAQ